MVGAELWFHQRSTVRLFVRPGQGRDKRRVWTYPSRKPRCSVFEPTRTMARTLRFTEQTHRSVSAKQAASSGGDSGWWLWSGDIG